MVSMFRVLKKALKGLPKFVVESYLYLLRGRDDGVMYYALWFTTCVLVCLSVGAPVLVKSIAFSFLVLSLIAPLIIYLPESIKTEARERMYIRTLPRHVDGEEEERAIMLVMPPEVRQQIGDLADDLGYTIDELFIKSLILLEAHHLCAKMGTDGTYSIGAIDLFFEQVTAGEVLRDET